MGTFWVRLSFERFPIHVHSVQNMCRQIDEILITLPRNFVHLVEKPTDLQLMNEVWHAVGLWLWDGFDDLSILGKSGKYVHAWVVGFSFKVFHAKGAWWISFGPRYVLIFLGKVFAILGLCLWRLSLTFSFNGRRARPNDPQINTPGHCWLPWSTKIQLRLLF